MSQILIFEPFANGHRMIFVRYLIQSAIRYGGLGVVLAVSEASRVLIQVAELVEEFGEILTLVTVAVPDKEKSISPFIWPKFARQFAYFAVLQNLVVSRGNELGINYVFIPFLDSYCLLPMALKERPFGNTLWGGIVIRPRHHLHHMNVILPQRWSDYFESLVYRFLWRKKALDHIFCIDPYFRQFYPNARLTGVPDPSDIQSTIPEDTCFGIKPNSIVLLVYGYIDQRKGMDRLFAALSDDRITDDLILLVVGMQDKQLQPLLNSEAAETLRAAGRLVEVNRIVSDREEAAAFARADVVWIYYPRSYCSSGALVRAGQSACPVLATSEGVVGRAVSELGMGLVVGEEDREGLILALVQFAKDADLRKRLGKSGFEHFSEATSAAFGDPIIAQIAKALGM